MTLLFIRHMGGKQLVVKTLGRILLVQLGRERNQLCFKATNKEAFIQTCYGWTTTPPQYFPINAQDQ